MDNAVKVITDVNGISQIATTLSGDVQFFSQLFVTFEQINLMSLFASRHRRHHAAGTASNYCYSTH
jgi:hypothetical protein